MFHFNLILVALIVKSTLTITSPAFKEGEFIPARYTCDDENINPELIIDGLPSNAKSLALIMDDPDAADGTFDHWIMWNISPTNKIGVDNAPGTQGQNGKKENRYTGPCPPKGVHHYHFKVYALDNELTLEAGADKTSLENAMKGHILSSGELVGIYKR